MRPGAHHAVTSHPVHLAVVLFIQPQLKRGLTGGEVGIGDPHLLEAEIDSPLFYILR